MPLVQRQPGEHAMVHAPQLSGSICSLTHAPLQEVSSATQLGLAPPLDAPPVLAPAWPAPACSVPACPAPELPALGAPERPSFPAAAAAPFAPALLLLAPALPALPAPPDAEPAAPAEPPSDVVLLEQASTEKHAPQARRRNHNEPGTGFRSAISLPNSEFEFNHGIGVWSPLRSARPDLETAEHF